MIMDKKGAGAAVDFGQYLPMLIPSSPSSSSSPVTTTGENVYKLMEDLSHAPSLKEQMALLQVAKQQLRPQIMTIMQQMSTSSSSESISNDSACVVALLMLYLLPVTLPLRKSLDWVFDMMVKDQQKVDSSLQTDISREVNCKFFPLMS